MLKRPGVEKGRNVPEPHRIKEMMKNKDMQEEEAKSVSNWVMKGQSKDAKK